MIYVKTTQQSEQGFTLVELAIVMVIIGLLIGGILKGQELIANAKISATVGQLKGLDAGMNTFQDKYNAVAGDMNDATTRLPNCAAPCGNGNGNGRVAGSFAIPSGTSGDTAESYFVFTQMNAADLISGIDTSGSSITFGKLLPAVKAGGGMWVGLASTVPAGTTLQLNRQYAVLNGSVATVAGTTGALSATSAAQIDRKLDDGTPNSGSVQVEGTNCATTATPVAYAENSTTAVCALYSRVLN